MTHNSHPSTISWASLLNSLVIVAGLVMRVSAVTIPMVTVGNPGNVGDPVTGFGAVAYDYRIGKYDVTNSQYVEFLNSNDPTGANALSLYSASMSSSPFGGVNYNSAAASGGKYSVIAGRGENPVNFVTFYTSLRFANWLNNGQTPGSTETGAYTLLGGTPTPSNAGSITRNVGANVFLPSENEWYKAAYYNPTTSSYFLYPTSSNTAPTATGPTATPNSVNYKNVVGNVTGVGAYSGTTSPYGAFDLGGNVWQWNEALIDSFRGIRGSAFDRDPSSFMLSSNRIGSNPTFVNAIIGFRVASVPEPSTFALGAAAIASLAFVARRR